LTVGPAKIIHNLTIQVDAPIGWAKEQRRARSWAEAARLPCPWALNPLLAVPIERDYSGTHRAGEGLNLGGARAFTAFGIPEVDEA
jgi:hypothetical protein